MAVPALDKVDQVQKYHKCYWNVDVAVCARTVGFHITVGEVAVVVDNNGGDNGQSAPGDCP